MIRPQAQPYRKGQQQPGGALTAMLAGKPQFMQNPAVLRQQQMKRIAELVRMYAR